MKSRMTSSMEDGIIRVMKRFPLVYILTICMTGIAMFIERNQIFGVHENAIERYSPALMALAIAIPLALAISLFCETRKIKKYRSIGLQLLGITVCILLILSFPPFEDMALRHHILFINAVIASVLACFIAPFLQTSKQSQFWKFCQALGIRAVTTAIFSGALAIGALLALALFRYLFQHAINDEVFINTTFFIIGIIGTPIFLAGIPQQEHIDVSEKYLKIENFFTKLILVPLTSIYTALLSIYFIRILVTQDWPMSSVAYLVLALAALGFFTIALLLPQREQIKWSYWFIKGFGIVIIPLTGMLFWSIERRIAEYGLTEKRYFVAVLGVWIAVAGIFLAIRKKISVRNFAISLAVLAIFTAIGPWSASRLSITYQSQRLRTILEEQQLLNNDTVIPGSDVGFEERKKMSRLLDYLEDVQGFYAIDPWFEEARKTNPPAFQTNAAAETYMFLANQNYVTRWDTSEEFENITQIRSFSIGTSGTTRPFRSIVIAGFDTMLDFELSLYEDMSFDKEYFDTTLLSLKLEENGILSIENNNTTIAETDTAQQFTQLLQKYPDMSNDNITPESMIIDIQNENIRGKIFISYISADCSLTDNEPPHIRIIEGKMFIENLRPENEMTPLFP